MAKSNVLQRLKTQVCYCRLLLCRLSVLLLFAGVFVGLVAAQAEAAAKKRRITIEVVQDGPSRYLDDLAHRVEQELRLLVAGEFEVVFISDAPYSNGNWDLERIKQALTKATKDSRSNIVFTNGVIATYLASQARLTKPVVGGIVFPDAEIVGIPYRESGSARPNFTFTAVPHLLQQDIEAFHRLVPTRIVHVFLDSAVIEGCKEIKKNLLDLEIRLGIKLHLELIDSSGKNTLRHLGNDVEAVYLTPAFRMNETEWLALISGIEAKKIPSYSILGYPDVELGVLFGSIPDMSGQIARRIALNMQQIMQGESADKLPVPLRVARRLAINDNTAMKIGYSPEESALAEANLMQDQFPSSGEPLTLEQAMLIAAKNNIDLAVQQAKVESSRQQKNKAFSYLLPQVSGNLQYDQIDPDRARESWGFFPEKQTTIGFSASQTIFDDAVISGYRGAKRIYQGTVFEQEAVRLDVMANTARRFLEYAAACSLAEIEKANLELTQKNLDLAVLRHQIGIAGPEEMYRWETQRARNRSSLFAAESRVEQARVALNQALGLDQAKYWQPAPVYLKDDDYYFLGNRLKDAFRNERRLRTFEKFAVQIALENSPGVKSVEESIQAQRIELGRLRRRFVTPDVTARFLLNHKLGETIITPDIPLDPSIDEFASSFADSNNTDWGFGITVSLPLLEGGGRFCDVAKAKSDLSQLLSSLERLKQLIEQQTRSVLYSIQSSHPNIRLTRIAASEANKNLRVVREKYARGTAPIIDLLDAQNQALVEEQAAVLAVYGYLQNIIELQRAISWFEVNKNEAEKKEMLNDLSLFYQSQR